MPSSAENSFTSGDYLNANARYRRHHVHHSRLRHRNHTPIHEYSRTRSPAPEVASTSVATFDWKEPIRWTDVDVSTVLKPNDFVNFPPDPAPFKLPPDPSTTKDYAPPDWVGRRMFYLFALLLMAVLCTGAAREIGMLKTCHKRYPSLLAKVRDQPKWMPSSVWKHREALRNLT